MKNEQRNIMNFKLIPYIAIMLICSSIAIADQKVISSEDDFKGGSFSDLQLNRNPSNNCDASRYISTGYDYADTSTNPPGTCNRCDGSGNIVNVPNGQDTFNECSAITCSDYTYGWSTKYCQRYAASLENNGDCNGAGACYTSLADSCYGGGSYSARCDHVDCVKPETCLQGELASNYDSVSEICYTSVDDYSCRDKYECNDQGNCINVWSGWKCLGECTGSYIKTTTTSEENQPYAIQQCANAGGKCVHTSDWTNYKCYTTSNYVASGSTCAIIKNN
ncbi:MAG: hypothetical protein U9R34_07180 [Nanoarchaeota archaeon]|nr:hypothetical protein [Nanoarchaeota archaeon]